MTSLTDARRITAAHRGASAEYGDNTMEAYLAAIAARNAIEADVRRTLDRVLVLAHDAEVNGQLVHQLTYAELRKRNPRIVPLSWLLEHARTTVLILEVKYAGITAEPGPIEAAVINELERHGRPLGGELTAVSSFSPSCLRTFQIHAPELNRFLILGSPARPAPVRGIAELFTLARGIADAIVPDENDVTSDLVRQAHAHALGVFPYPPRPMGTVEEQKAAVRANLDAGCNGGHFDRPALHTAALGGAVVPAPLAMREFLSARRRAAERLDPPQDVTATTIGRLGELLITWGGADSLSLADLREAERQAERRDVRDRILELIRDRQQLERGHGRT